MVEFLRTTDLAVEAPAYDLPTAFVARAGSGRTRIGVCAEYDALPGIGQACGHNVIAGSSVGAAIGMAAVAHEVGLTVRLIGTPAEEAGDASGKIVLLERGAFDDLDAAMMVHPAPFDIAEPVMIAVAAMEVEYTGKEAHAAMYPELGVNAADAQTVAQVGIGLLRQHIRSTDRIHGIVLKGGEAANIVPAHTTARYFVRSRTIEDLAALRPRVLACFEAGATATGCDVHIEGGASPYADVRHDARIAAIYRANAERLGRVFPDTPDLLTRPSGSTDMGNVSHAVPSIHPFIGIDSWPAVNHQPEFTAHTIKPAADRALIDAAVAMAWTAIDLAQAG
jgi:amidohydrolase